MNEDNLADDFFDEASEREINKRFFSEADHATNLLHQIAIKIDTPPFKIMQWYVKKQLEIGRLSPEEYTELMRSLRADQLKYIFEYELTMAEDSNKLIELFKEEETLQNE